MKQLSILVTAFCLFTFSLNAYDEKFFKTHKAFFPLHFYSTTIEDFIDRGEILENLYKATYLNTFHQALIMKNIRNTLKKITTHRLNYLIEIFEEGSTSNIVPLCQTLVEYTYRPEYRDAVITIIVPYFYELIDHVKKTSWHLKIHPKDVHFLDKIGNFIYGYENNFTKEKTRAIKSLSNEHKNQDLFQTDLLEETYALYAFLKVLKRRYGTSFPMKCVLFYN